MTCSEPDRWSEDIAAYMLGALEPVQAAELERHAEDCERCRSEMRWLTAAVEALPEAVERREPPPALRERLLTEVRDDARAEAAGDRSTQQGSRRGFGWLTGSGAHGWRPLGAIAAVALVVVALAGYEIGSGGTDSGGSKSTFVAGAAPGVVAKVTREGDGGEIRLANVKRLPDERVLEAWLQRDGEVEPVKALFVPDPDGNATTNLGNIKGVEAVLVTTEPAGGSKAPTSTPIADVKIETS